MATSDKLQKLIDTKEAIRLAINEKGGSVTTSDTFASYPNSILALSAGGSSSGSTGDGEEFKNIGYTYFPYHISKDIAHSEEYMKNHNERNDNVLQADNNLIYFPKIEINDDIDEVTFSQTGSSGGYFYTNFPNVLVFPNFDFKGKTIIGYSNDTYGMFYQNYTIRDIYLNNAKTNFKSLFNNCNKAQYIKLENCNNANTAASNMFYQCELLEKVIFENVDTSNTTTFNNMFNGCKLLESIEGLNTLNTSSVTDISSLFNQCNNLKEIDLSKWDVSKVTSMNNMFSGCGCKNINLSNWRLESYNSKFPALDNVNYRNIDYIDLSNWYLPKYSTTTSYPQFGNIVCSYGSEQGILNCSNWQLPNLLRLSSTFSNLYVKKVDLSGWNLPLLTNIASFFSAFQVQEVDLSDWKFGSSNITLQGLFSNYNNTTLKKFSLSNWDFSRFTQITFISTSSYYYTGLTTIVGPVSGIKVNVNLKAFSALDVDSVMVFINGLEQVDTTQTLTLHTNQKNLLTEDQIAIATSKGWTIA